MWADPYPSLAILAVVGFGSVQVLLGDGDLLQLHDRHPRRPFLQHARVLVVRRRLLTRTVFPGTNTQHWILKLLSHVMSAFSRMESMTTSGSVHTCHFRFCSFTLMETDSCTDSDSKTDGYIVLCRTCSPCTNSDTYSSFLYRTGIRVCTRVRHHQCKWVICLK